MDKKQLFWLLTPFFLITFDTPLIRSTFVASRRTSFLLYHLQQMIVLEQWKLLSPLDIFLSSFSFSICFQFDRTVKKNVWAAGLGSAAESNCQKTRCNKSLSVFQTTSSPYFSLNYSSFLHQSVNLILVITLHRIQ